MSKIKLNNTNNDNGNNKSIKINKKSETVYNSSVNIAQDAVEQLKDLDMDDVNNDNNSLDVEMTPEELEKSKKRYKNLKIKKIIILVVLILTLLSIVFFGVYNTFFKHEYSGAEIASLSNYYNGQTNYPKDGIQGYLDVNVNKLLKEKLTIDSDINSLDINDPIVTRINPKSDTLANVYFYTKITTNHDDEYYVNCVLPIYWNRDIMMYQPAGEIIFTSNSSTADDITEQKNSLLSFDDIATETDENNNSSKTFVDNFFTMLYTNQNIDPYYEGEVKLVPGDLKYKNIKTYQLYANKNKNGYNAYAEIFVTTPNGVTYLTKKYLAIEKSGKSWIITAVL